MIAFLGLGLVHLLGSASKAMGWRGGFVLALRSPSSTMLGLAVAWFMCVGAPHSFLLVATLALGFLFSARRTETSPLGRGPWLAALALGVLVLARPWVPTEWDEFVWLAKARFGAFGFRAGLEAALDPAQGLIPAGYPPLWPLAVGWLSLGQDAVQTHVLAASLLVVVCAAVALEAWWDELKAAPRWTLALAVAAPLVVVHVRTTYVDLPVGLLGLALLGFLLKGGDRPAPQAVAIAVVLAGFKDEGLAHVVAATLAAALVVGPRRWRLYFPALAAVAAFATWRALVQAHGVTPFDHALGVPAWGWAGTLASLFLRHATDPYSWGFFWPVVAAVALSRPKTPEGRALTLLVAFNLLFAAGAVLAGPERVRAFAENGTLLNRLLVQAWPGAAMLLLVALRSPSAVPARSSP